MSATSQLTDLSDLVADLSVKLRGQTGVTATSNIMKRAINTALHDMHLGMDYKFPWAERSARILTRAQYSTGTVTATQGSTALTGTSTVWTTTDAFGIANARANGKIKIAGGLTPYTVSSVGGAGTITLSSEFTEATATDTTYIYYEDEYALASDFLRPVDAQVFSDEASIEIIGRTEFRRLYPTNSTPGRVAVASIIDFAPSGNTTPIRRVRFAPPPSTAMTIPYTYITGNLAVSSAGVAAANMSADSDEPIIPLRYRHALVFHALYHLYRDRKDDSRSQEAKAEYTDIMNRMQADTEVGANRPRFAPRTGPYASRARRPWRGGGGRYDLNGRFDRLEDR